MAPQQHRISAFHIWANGVVARGKALQTNRCNGVKGFDGIGIRSIHIRRFLLGSGTLGVPQLDVKTAPDSGKLIINEVLNFAN